MNSVVVALLSFAFSNCLSYIVYERTRRKIYLRIFMIGNTFALLCGIFILIMEIIKTQNHE